MTYSLNELNLSNIKNISFHYDDLWKLIVEANVQVVKLRNCEITNIDIGMFFQCLNNNVSSKKSLKTHNYL